MIRCLKKITDSDTHTYSSHKILILSWHNNTLAISSSSSSSCLVVKHGYSSYWSKLYKWIGLYFLGWWWWRDVGWNVHVMIISYFVWWANVDIGNKICINVKCYCCEKSKRQSFTSKKEIYEHHEDFTSSSVQPIISLLSDLSDVYI